jgi:hypothetical protein
VVFDVLYVWLGNPTFAAVGYWNIAAGIVGGLLAAVFGVIDWLAIPAGTRAKRIGLLHGGANIVVVLAFAVVWLLRGGAIDLAPKVGSSCSRLGLSRSERSAAGWGASWSIGSASVSTPGHISIRRARCPGVLWGHDSRIGGALRRRARVP